MPAKKGVEETKNNIVAFGRVRKNLKMGCVGLPNVGKSSLFNLLTEQSAPAENYPFCTIEPNEARCAVPDIRYVSLWILEMCPVAEILRGRRVLREWFYELEAVLSCCKSVYR